LSLKTIVLTLGFSLACATKFKLTKNKIKYYFIILIAHPYN
jgi:hypothetical protein